MLVDACFFLSKSQVLLATVVFRHLSNPLNHSNCRARPNSSIQNNIIVAKFSMQIRRAFFAGDGMEKCFHVNIHSKWFAGEFAAERKHSFSIRHRIILEILCELFSLLLIALRRETSTEAKLLQHFLYCLLSFGPKSPIWFNFSLKRWSQKNSLTSCDSANSETTNWFIILYGHFITFVSMYFWKVLIILNRM